MPILNGGREWLFYGVHKGETTYGLKSDWPIPRLGQGAFRIGLEAVYKVFQAHSSIKMDH